MTKSNYPRILPRGTKITKVFKDYDEFEEFSRNFYKKIKHKLKKGHVRLWPSGGNRQTRWF